MSLHTLSFVTAAALLLAAPAHAQSTGDVASLWKGPATTTAKRASSSPKDSDSTVSRAAALARTARQQADTIVALRAKLASIQSATAETVAPKVVTVDATPLALTVARLNARIDSLELAQAATDKHTAAREQQVAQQLSGLGNFKFGGDVRVRYEGQFQGGDFPTRHRERTRARLTIGANVADDLTGAIGVATGTLDDVQSPNQTESGFFARKTIAFDRFYLTWKPKAVTGFSATAGKFPYTWDRTALTFGNDINPEGASSAYTLTTKSVLQSATVVGFVLPYLEVAAGNDSYVMGEQFQTRWSVAPRTIARFSVASVDFRGADAIAQAISAATIKPGSPNTNPFRTDSTGKVLGYKSAFEYTDVIVGVDFLASAHWPITVQADAVRNRRADPSENTGVWTDLRVGRLSQLRDVQATWSFIRIERDAVIGAFDEQDLRAATNTLSHKLAVSYQWRSNATLGLGAWYGRLLDPSLTGKIAAPAFVAACTSATPTTCRDPWLSRIQFDLSYRF